MTEDPDFEVEEQYHIYELKSVMESNSMALKKIEKVSYPHDGFESKKEAKEWLEKNTSPWRYDGVVILSTINKNVIYD